MAHTSKVRGWNGISRRVGHRQRRAQAAGISSAHVDQEVVVFGGELAGLRPHRGAAQGDGGVVVQAGLFAP
jgi:hypothetical protein